jgi:hypothetical protein
MQSRFVLVVVVLVLVLVLVDDVARIVLFSCAVIMVIFPERGDVPGGRLCRT